MITFKFDPKQYGFDTIDNFPELGQNPGADSFVKVTATHNGKCLIPSYWYLSIRKVISGDFSDDRWAITANSWNERSGCGRARDVYIGPIASAPFAFMLLKSLMAARTDASVEDHGYPRLIDREMNKSRLG